jgi:hypothetical protein
MACLVDATLIRSRGVARALRGDGDDARARVARVRVRAARGRVAGEL